MHGAVTGGQLRHAPADDLVASIDEALARGRIDEAAGLVEEAASAFVSGTSMEAVPLDRLEAWMHRVSAVAGDRPWLLYYQAWVAGSLRQQRLAGLTLERAAAGFAAQSPGPHRDRAILLARLAQGVVAERDGRLETARDRFAEARALLGMAGRLPTMVSQTEAARWLAIDPAGAMAFWLEAAATYEASAELVALSRALHNLATFCVRRGEPLPARRLAAEACELKRGTAPAVSYAASRNALGMAERMLGDGEAARDDLEEARAIARRAGQRLLAAYALANLAEVECDAGEDERADEHFARSAAEKQANGDDYGLAFGLRAQAAASRRRDQADAALGLARRAWLLRAHAGDREEHAELLAELGACLLAAGRPAEAAPLLAQSAAVAAEFDAKATEALARLAQGAAGDREAAEAGIAIVEANHLRHLAPEVALARSGGYRPRARPQPAGMRARLIGGFSLEVAGAPIPWEQWRSRKAGEMLRLLTLLRGRPVHADELLDWLWPGRGSRAGTSLNAAATAIRRALEAAGGDRGWLERRHDSYRLQPFAWTDLDEFDSLVAGAERAWDAGRADLAVLRLLEAVDPWRGRDVLPDDRYAAWGEQPRSQLAAAVRRARERLVEVALAAGHLDTAVDAARELVALEPAHEPGHRLLIRALLARHDVPGARRALEECRRALRRELGVEPARRTAALLDGLD